MRPTAFFWGTLLPMLLTTYLLLHVIALLSDRGKGQPPLTQDCSLIRDLRNSVVKPVKTGWMKAVYLVNFGGGQGALKIIHEEGVDLKECVRWEKLEICRRKLHDKLKVEADWLGRLQNPGIIKMLGYCFEGGGKEGEGEKDFVGGWGALVTEVGTPVDLIELVQTPWELRVKAVYDVSQLLVYLAKGNLWLPDFKREQFVWVGDQLKLTDLDDLRPLDPKCTSDSDCDLNPDSNHPSPIACLNGHCQDYALAKNRLRAYDEFVNICLSPGSPAQLRPQAQATAQAFANLSIPFHHVIAQLETLIQNYKQWDYEINSTDNDPEAGFVSLANRSLVGEMWDYNCPGSFSRSQCVVTVGSLGAAQAVCRARPTCKAFLWTNQTTWLGKRKILLKNGYSDSDIAPSDQVSLHIRPDIKD